MALVLLLSLLSLGAADDALNLSRYLSSPTIGRNLSRVALPAPFASLVSHSGLFEIAPGRYTFFWFFPHPTNRAAPTMTWLQGGPGASSMFGLFSEHGPFSVAADGVTLVPRATAWTQFASMLYIDNPVGVGLSRTNVADGFVHDENQVGRDLYSFISQFFIIFGDRAANPLWIAGESYGGKYAPAMAYELSQRIASGESALRLAGVLVGDGALDPLTQFTGFADLTYYMGFADINERATIQAYEDRIAKLIGEQEWIAAFEVFDELLNGDFFPYPTYFRNITGLSDYFNELSPTYPPNPYQAWIQQRVSALHAGSGAVYWDYNATVERNLITDWMQGVTPKLESLLANYSVLVYNGQLDVILGAPLCLNALAKLQWSGAAQFAAAKKQVWRLADSTVAGYVLEAVSGPRRVGLTHATVRLAGHMVPSDAPEFAFDLAKRFITGAGFQ